MAQKILVLYKRDGFDEDYYVSKHLPLATHYLQGVVSVEVGMVVGEGPYHRVALLEVPEGQTVDEVMAAPGMKATLADVKNYTKEGGVEVLVYQT
jgi:uncharacterized protein (TIGR02118 family)